MNEHEQATSSCYSFHEEFHLHDDSSEERKGLQGFHTYIKVEVVNVKIHA